MIKLAIEKMTCDHCVKSVTEALSKVPGVEKVIDVNLSRKEALVSGHARPEQLIRAVAEAGFEARQT
jgi:copper chaperone CopZ